MGVLKIQKNLAKRQFFKWPQSTEKIIKRLNSPEKIQKFLDNCRYNKSEKLHTPLDVLIQRCAHCLDGAVFAASVLNYFGEPSLIIDLCAVRDDDHILAVFRNGSYFGAIAKSNYSGLRYREPIFKTERELVLSYFESYYNLKREKTLRSYSKLFNLLNLRKLNWEDREQTFEKIVTALEKSKHYDLLTKNTEKLLTKVDRRMFKAGLVGKI